jgi:hypothetical protein
MPCLDAFVISQKRSRPWENSESIPISARKHRSERRAKRFSMLRGLKSLDINDEIECIICSASFPTVSFLFERAELCFYALHGSRYCALSLFRVSWALARRKTKVTPQLSHVDIAERCDSPRRRKIAAAIATLGLIASTGSAEAEANGPGCDVERFQMGAATTTYHTGMRVEKKSTCGVFVHDGGTGGARNYRVSIRASHGQAAVTNLIATQGFAYKPNPGYVGKDHFQITFEILTVGSKIQATMDVDVDIVDKM